VLTPSLTLRSFRTRRTIVSSLSRFRSDLLSMRATAVSLARSESNGELHFCVRAGCFVKPSRIRRNDRQ
jgi:hypothetical protein